jgi:hypothetical protein
LASTGSVASRRAFLKAGAAAPLALASAGGARSADDQAPAEVFEAIARLEADVDGRLAALERAMPAAAAFASSVRRDRARHRAERGRLRGRLGLSGDTPLPLPAGGDASLEGLRGSQQALVHAHAEGLPALRDGAAVHRLAAHLVDLARHLTVIELWIEQEEGRE